MKIKKVEIEVIPKGKKQKIISKFIFENYVKTKEK